MSDPMNINDMVLFAKVAEQKGISKAARLLNIPKSKVSRRIATLEDVLGVRLLERTTRSVTLTEIGQIFLGHCQRISEEADNALASIQQMSDTPRGVLKISVSTATGQYLIAPHLAEFNRLYPDVKVQMDLNNRRVDLISEGYDLVLRVGALQDSNLVSKLIGRARATLVASPSYLKEYGTPATPKELETHKLGIMSQSSLTRQWVLEHKDGAITSLDAEPEISVNDFTALRILLEDGAGISILPSYITEESIQQGKLVQIMPEWTSPEISYYVLYPSRMGLTKKARAWIDFFSTKLGKKDPRLSRNYIDQGRSELTRS